MKVGVSDIKNYVHWLQFIIIELPGDAIHKNSPLRRISSFFVLALMYLLFHIRQLTFHSVWYSTELN